MSCCGGTWSSGSIGAWRCHISSCRQNQFLCNTVTWKTYRYTVEPACRFFWYDICFRQNHSQRTGPVFLCKDPCFFGNLCNNPIQIMNIRNMYDQRIIRRPALCRIYFHGCLRVQRISSKAVYRLCRKCHETSFFQDLATSGYRIPVYIFRCHNCYFCFHLTLHYCLI